MSKEQLKEADEWLYSMRCLLSVKTDEEDRAYTQKRIDLFNWLIKQAELGLIHQEQFHDMQTKNLQLQKRVQELKDKVNDLTGLYNSKNSDFLKEKLMREHTYETNKRYREALEFYADENNYEIWNSMAVRGPEINRDKGYKARKALKGDKQ